MYKNNYSYQSLAHDISKSRYVPNRPQQVLAMQDPYNIYSYLNTFSIKSTNRAQYPNNNYSYIKLIK